MSTQTSGHVVRHGWTIFAHPLFMDQVETLARQVQDLRDKDPEGFTKKNATKRLAAIVKLAFDVIPENPTKPEFRQGITLGEDHKHWFRAKFFQQYRLFFRYHTPSKMIVLAWVNDSNSKRAYESDDDAYLVFKKMLSRGNPPNDWDQLLSASISQNAKLGSLSAVLEITADVR